MYCTCINYTNITVVYALHITGILVGRECLPDATMYCSKESHYSLLKAARMYRMKVALVNITYYCSYIAGM